MPPNTSTIAVTMATRAAPRSAMITPMNTSGNVFGDQVPEARVQERRGDDPPQVADVARLDPVGVELVVVERVDHLDDPHHRDDAGQQREALD